MFLEKKKKKGITALQLDASAYQWSCSSHLCPESYGHMLQRQSPEFQYEEKQRASVGLQCLDMDVAEALNSETGTLYTHVYWHSTQDLCNQHRLCKILL